MEYICIYYLRKFRLHVKNFDSDPVIVYTHKKNIYKEEEDKEIKIKTQKSDVVRQDYLHLQTATRIFSPSLMTSQLTSKIQCVYILVYYHDLYLYTKIIIY